MKRFLFSRHCILGLIALVVLGVVCVDYLSAIPGNVQAQFVGRSKCLDCHQTEAALFDGSHHDLAMDVATDATVLGDFDDVTFEHDGLQNRLFRDGEKFMVHTEGADGKMHDFQIKYVFGVDPLQQYMVEFDRTDDMPPNEISRLQVLRISWDTKNKRWFYLRPPDVPEKLAPDDPLHWTGSMQRWQTMCADCHSTDLKRNFDVATGRYHTTFSEIDVSCEACHGPGSLHVELANSKSLFWDRNHGYGLAKLKGDDANPQLETCAPCHSRRGVLDDSFQAGQKYHDFFALELLQPQTYHADGQIKDEVYVYGSFVQSKMYHKGIRCTDCHDPHSLELKHPGNETCTSCHQHAAGKYDVPSHHHHAPGTDGAMCVNCHMPHTTYMDVDPRRDHSLRIPRPDLSVEIGTPNACSSCHVKDQLKSMDEATRKTFAEKDYAAWQLAAQSGNETIGKAIRASDKWCDEACERWYADQRNRSPHFAVPLSKFRNGDAGAAKELLKLASASTDRISNIARATVIHELAMAGVHDAVKIAKDLVQNTDEDPQVRAAAVDVFLQTGPTTTKKYLLPLLNDDSPLVRGAATRVLLSTAYPTLDPAERSQVDQAVKELKKSIMIASDRAGAHMNWGMICEQQGRLDEALQAYETALRLEPSMTGPRTNLASVIEQSMQHIPPQLREDMNMRIKDLRREEMKLLQRDANLLPDNPDIHYRYGLSLYLNEQYDEALKHLQKAVDLAPDNRQFRMTKGLLEEKLNQ